MQDCRTWNTLMFLWCTVNVMAGRPKQVVMCLSSIINPSNHKTSTFDEINAIFLMIIQETIQRWGDGAASENKKIGHLLWVRLSFTLLKQSYSSPNCPETKKKSVTQKLEWMFHTTSLISATQKVAWETPQLY